MPDTDRFDWADYDQPFSLTLVRGLDDEGIIAQLGLLGDDPQPQAFAEVSDDQENEYVINVQIAPLDGWIAVIEDNGFYGSLPEHLGPLSAGGAAVNVFWNVNAVTSFGYAEAGTVTRFFDPSGINANEGATLAQEAGLDFEDEDGDPVGLALLLMERLTGTTIDGEWVTDQSRRIYTVRGS
jgi:hypothetical protein